MDFMQGVVIYYAPLLLSILLMVLFGFVWIPAGIGIGILIQTMYRFPQEPEKQTTILDQMRNPYASPIRGTSIRLTGNAIGRGMPGYIFSEDVMYQDSTGLIFLDYSSLFGFIGNLFFAINQVKKIIGTPSTVDAWFFRGMGPYAVMKKMKTTSETIVSHPILWSILKGLFFIGISLFIYYRGI